MGSLLLHTLIWSSFSGTALPPQAPAKPAQVQVLAYSGDVSTAIAKETCSAIENNFSLPCRYRIVRRNQTWLQGKKRIDAAAFLDAQFSRSANQTDPRRAAPKRGQITLWLTSKDLYEGTRPFVFGIMSMTDRIGIVSLHRLKSWDREVTKRRLKKVVVHELAHALDLGHHDLDSCVMQVEPDLAHLDQGSSSLCPRCRAKASRTAQNMQRQGQFLWDRAIGHKVRGELRQAQSMLLALLEEKQTDPEIQANAQSLWSRLLTK